MSAAPPGRCRRGHGCDCLLYVLAIVLVGCFVSVSGRRVLTSSRRRYGDVPLSADSRPADDTRISMDEAQHQTITPSNAELSTILIRTDVNNRFATTTITHRMLNINPTGKSVAVFEYPLPKTAFVVNFTSLVDGRFYKIDYQSEVVTSSDSKRLQPSQTRTQFSHTTTRRRQGEKYIKHIMARLNDQHLFRVELPIINGANGRAEFNLTYQEMLVRKLGTYELSVALVSPAAVASTAANNGNSSSSSRMAPAGREIRVDVKVREMNEISDILVLPPHPTAAAGNTSEDNPQVAARIRRPSSNVFYVNYVPTMPEQVRWSRTDHQQYRMFTVRYDVRHQLDAGEVQIKDGYFVHQFAPSGLQPISKNVVFVLDSSSSMTGNKMAQVKDAVIGMLDDMHASDTFNVIAYSTEIRYFNNVSCLVATSANIGNAKTFVTSLEASTGANMNDALLRAVEFLVRQEEADPLATHISMVFLITDGPPSKGITDPSRILANVRQASGSRVSIFPIGLGFDVDFRFLEQLAQQNRGATAARLPVDSPVQLSGSASDDEATIDIQKSSSTELATKIKSFFHRVASPLLENVRVRYDDLVDETTLTDADFPAYFEGSEIVVAGRLKSAKSPVGSSSNSGGGGQHMSVKVSGGSTRGYMSLDTRVKIPRASAAGSSADSGGGGGSRSGSLYPHQSNNVMERAWAYLTVRKMLRKAAASGSTGSDEATRTSTMAHALQAASQYSFITPYTPVVLREVEKPDNGYEIFYKDLDAEAAELADRRRLAASRKRPLVADESEQPSSARRSFVESDPHFLVSVAGLSVAVCFDVTGVPGTVYQLIQDRITDVIVNALFTASVGSPTPSGDMQNVRNKPTYIGQLGILHGPCHVVIDPRSIHVDGVLHHWSANTTLISCGRWMTVNITGKRHVTVVVQPGVILSVMRHLIHPTASEVDHKVDHLGFYVESGYGFSEYTHGIIGQFMHQKARQIRSSLNMSISDATDNVHLSSWLAFSGGHSSHRTVRAVMRSRRDMHDKKSVPCWHVASHDGVGLIRETPESYIVDSILTKTSSFHRRLRRR